MPHIWWFEPLNFKVSSAVFEGWSFSGTIEHHHSVAAIFAQPPAGNVPIGGHVRCLFVQQRYVQMLFDQSQLSVISLHSSVDFLIFSAFQVTAYIVENWSRYSCVEQAVWPPFHGYQLPLLSDFFIGSVYLGNYKSIHGSQRAALDDWTVGFVGFVGCVVGDSVMDSCEVTGCEGFIVWSLSGDGIGLVQCCLDLWCNQPRYVKALPSCSFVVVRLLGYCTPWRYCFKTG